MTEAVSETPNLYKIWKNPSRSGEPVSFLGEYRPPDGRFFFTARDLRELGFGPGNYTVLAPANSQHPKLFSKWQKVTVTND
jgi:hypothetical protein